MAQLSPGTFKGHRPRLYGFDCETYGHKNRFLCASIVGNDYQKTFLDKDELISALQNRFFAGTKIVATNLMFDFSVVFDKTPELRKFRTLFRGSDLIYAKVGIDDSGGFININDGNDYQNILTFIDTMSFCPFSVEKLGDIIKIPKMQYPGFLGQKMIRKGDRDDFKTFYDYFNLLKTDVLAKAPDFVGRKPANQEEWDYLKKYNINDALISWRFMEFIYSACHSLGADVKNTIASTAMSLFKNRYLNARYPVLDTPLLVDIFKSYYGGRTEAFVRGGDSDVTLNYYDVNSLYPYVAMSDMPDTRHRYVSDSDTQRYIENYMGMSYIDIKVPKTDYPVLPVKAGKVVFGYGQLSGWWCHNEILQAIDDGAEIEKVHKSIYFPAVCRPFDSYMQDMYKLRLRHKEEGSALELVDKMMMNALTGKFGQKFIDREEYTPIDSMTPKELQEMDNLDFIGDFIKTKKDGKPANFCQPHWISYITAYGRLHLLKYIRKYKAWYCDTDSLMTESLLEESKGLGGLKREMIIKDKLIVRPKFYGFRGIKGDKSVEIVRLKGLGWRPDYLQFRDIITRAISRDDGVFRGYSKFTRWKEANRRGIPVNTIIPISKNFGIEDDKRVWSGPFSPYSLQQSEPQEIIDGMTRTDRDSKMAKAMQDHDRRGREVMAEFIKSDHFDRFSVGKDITAEEQLRLIMDEGRFYD